MKRIVKSWEEMEKEFGLDSDGDINIPMYFFVKEMKDYCGTKIKLIKDLYCTSLHTDVERKWMFTSDMLKPIKTKTIYKVDDKVKLKKYDKIKVIMAYSGIGINHYFEGYKEIISIDVKDQCNYYRINEKLWPESCIKKKQTKKEK